MYLRIVLIWVLVLTVLTACGGSPTPVATTAPDTTTVATVTAAPTPTLRPTTTPRPDSVINVSNTHLLAPEDSWDPAPGINVTNTSKDWHVLFNGDALQKIIEKEGSFSETLTITIAEPVSIPETVHAGGKVSITIPVAIQESMSVQVLEAIITAIHPDADKAEIAQRSGAYLLALSCLTVDDFEANLIPDGKQLSKEAYAEILASMCGQKGMLIAVDTQGNPYDFGFVIR